MQRLRERLILNNTEMEDKLRDLQEILQVSSVNKEREVLLEWKQRAVKELTDQYTAQKLP